MKKLEQIQQNKLISNYGGVGSIIETCTNGSLLIQPYNEWNCYQNNNNHTIIEDPRLLIYVQEHGYNHVNNLVRIPDTDLSAYIYTATAANIGTTIKSKYFPEWYFCPRCRRLKKYNQWENSWVQRFPNDNGFRRNAPACYNCSHPQGNGIHRYPLQQIRFVMASLETGEVRDIPFDQLCNHEPNNELVWITQNVNAAQNLKYKTLRDGDGLNSVYIENEGNNQRTYLHSIEQRYIVRGQHAYKMMVRGSQSLYLPEIVRSIYIPIENPQDFHAATPDDINLHEFNYLTNDGNYINDMIVRENLIVQRKIVIENLIEQGMNNLIGSQFIRRISAIERLKETSVLLSYTRMGKANEQRMWYNVQLGEEVNMNAHSRRPFGDNMPFPPTYMPAVETYGEGVLFEVNHLENIDREEYLTFIHTFCHIVMKEMEFQCGYPLTSLKEKIYVDNDNNEGGFLIYTIAGNEGSYGGLTSLTNDNTIINLIERGVQRARYCPNDPICSNENAHCFACLDIPETSCAMFNKNLNRNTLLQYMPQFIVRERPNNVEQNETADNNEAADNNNERPVGLIL